MRAADSRRYANPVRLVAHRSRLFTKATGCGRGHERRQRAREPGHMPGCALDFNRRLQTLAARLDRSLYSGASVRLRARRSSASLAHRPRCLLRQSTHTLGAPAASQASTRHRSAGFLLVRERWRPGECGFLSWRVAVCGVASSAGDPRPCRVLQGAMKSEQSKGPLQHSGAAVAVGMGWFGVAWAARCVFTVNSTAIGKNNDAADRPGPAAYKPQEVVQRVPDDTPSPPRCSGPERAGPKHRGRIMRSGPLALHPCQPGSTSYPVTSLALALALEPNHPGR